MLTNLTKILYSTIIKSLIAEKFLQGRGVKFLKIKAKLFGLGEIYVDGKKVKFLALVYNPEKMQKKGVFVPGRFAMTCCEADIQFVGFKCKYPNAKEIPHKSWITITAEVRVEFAKEYRGKGPVLYPISIEPAEKPEDELVYFS